MKTESIVVLAGFSFLFAGLGMVHAEADAGAAEKLLEANKCTKCHAPAKSKSGPSWKKVAAKYKDNPAEGEEKIIKNITTAPMVKLDDGTEEEHKVIKEKDPAAQQRLWELYFASGYFNMASGSAEHFDALRRSFLDLGGRAARLPQLF